MAFRGTFEFTLDAKNRLTVPAKFRAALSEGVVLAKGIERNVALWPPSAYEAQIEAALAAERPGSKRWRDMRRFYSANSVDTELDAAGRVMVPPFLLEHAGLGREVVVTGAGECLEVWDRGGWSEYETALTTRMADYTESLDTSS